MYSLNITSPVIEHDKLLTKLETLDCTKGAGPDGIPPAFISSCAKFLVVPLLIINNTSLMTGIFPHEWKVAKVVPIHKCENDTVVSNYRPISILSSFAKIFESLVCPYIQNHLKKHLSESQHGFVKARSTCTNLVAFTELVTEALDSGKQVDVIYTDFSKAFDRVSHKILLQKLSAYGITGTLLMWLKSYLKKRTFFVVVNGFKSSARNITSGVPQGSHVGPVLFNVFNNDLPTCFQFSESFMYADDLKLGRVIDSVNDTVYLQSDLNRLIEWCERNGMHLNGKKCFHIKFSRRVHPIEGVYHIGNDIIETVDQIKDLGVIFDRKLTFLPHLESTIKKASKMLGFVIRNGKIFRNSRPKIVLFNSLVRSTLDYCSVVWRPHYATHSLRLERIQKRFMWHLVYSSSRVKKKTS